MLQLKSTGDIEPEMDTSIEEVVGIFSDKPFFDHGSGIGKLQLKYMSTSFDIYTNGDSIVIQGSFFNQLGIVFCVEGKSTVEFVSPANPKCHYYTPCFIGYFQLVFHCFFSCTSLLKALQPIFERIWGINRRSCFVVQLKYYLRYLIHTPSFQTFRT